MKVRIGRELQRRLAAYREVMAEGPETALRKALRKYARLDQPPLPEYRESTYTGTVLTLSGADGLTADEVRRLLWWWVPERMEQRYRPDFAAVPGRDYTVEESPDMVEAVGLEISGI